MRKIAGVNLRQSSLAICVGDARFRSLKPAGYEEVPLPHDGEARSNAMTEVLTRWKKTHAPAGVVLGLPLQSFSHQLIDMPSMKKSDMRNALLFELEKYLPMPVDEYCFDFVSMSGEKGRSRVLVLSLKKETVASVQQEVRKGGMEVISIRAAFLSAFSGLADLYGGKDLNGIFVNASEEAFEIAGLRDGVPVFLKSSPRNTDLAATLDRLGSQYPGRIFFAGTDDALPGGKFTVTRVHPRVPQQLALSAVRKGRFDLEFLDAGDAVMNLDFVPYAIAGMIAAAVLLYLLTGLLIFYKDSRALRDIEARRAAIKSRASGMLEARKKLDLLSADQRALAEFSGRSTIAVRTFSSLSTTLPKSAWLINMTVDDKGRIEIEGFTNRTSALIMAFEKSGLFKDVSYTAPIITKDGEERFALRMEATGHAQ